MKYNKNIVCNILDRFMIVANVNREGNGFSLKQLKYTTPTDKLKSMIKME